MTTDEANDVIQRKTEHPFEKALAVSREEISLLLHGVQETPWNEFLLNPRRLRGSDFLMR